MNEKEIMELIDAYAEARHHQGHSSYNAGTASARDAVMAAIAQLMDTITRREAVIKVLESEIEAVGAGGVQRMQAQKAALEPVAAPYAWVYVNKYGVESIPASKEWCEAMVSGHGGSMFPLYTRPAPQQAAQKRQPLTDEQLRDTLRSCPHDTVENLRVRWLYAKDFARAIEAAHGIKGSAA